MSDGTVVFIVIFAWLAIGVGIAWTLGRRGHDAFTWLLIGAVLGPLAVFLAIDAVGYSERRDVSIVSRGRGGPGSADLLVGVDGSASSQAALDLALTMLGPTVGRVELAHVVPFGCAEERRREALAILEAEAARHRDLRPTTEILHGHPAVALTDRARAAGFDLLVVGSRAAHVHPFGSAARELASSSPVPLLVVTGGAEEPSDFRRSDR